MRNLHVLSVASAVLSLPVHRALVCGELLVALAPDGSLAALALPRLTPALAHAQHALVELVGAPVVAVAHVEPQLVLALANGDLVTLNLHSGQAEIAGTLDSGIRAMAFASDGEVCAIVTGSYSLVLMSRYWDLLHEAPLPDSARLYSSLSLIPAVEGNKAPASLSIEWRADGDFFLVGRQDMSGLASFQVFNRQGEWQASSEAVPSLTLPCAWRPSGELIAALIPHGQGEVQETEIAFFERNGLRHGQFKVRGSVRDLQWSADGSVLAVVQGTYVGLYVRGNYHWYQKAALSITEDATVRWDEALGLAVVDSAGRTEYRQFATHVNIREADGALCVIDGPEAKITVLSKAIVPPPLAGGALTLPSVITGWAWGDKEAVALTSNGHLHLIDAPLKQTALKATSSVSSVDDVVLSALRHLLLVDDFLLAVEHVPDSNSDRLVCLALSPPSLLSAVELPSSALSLTSHTDEPSVVVVVLADGSVHELTAPYDELPTSAFAVVPGTWCVRVLNIYETLSVVALSPPRLSINGAVVSSSASSLALSADFLLFTTPSHLHFISRHAPLQQSLSLLDAPPARSPTHAIEAGARLVGSVGTCVVLQAARGSLETIHPHPLLLARARFLLSKLLYKDAFALARAHRLNLNLLYDYDPRAFVTHLPLFLEQVPSVDYLNLFVSGLIDDDVTRTLYADPWAPDAASAVVLPTLSDTPATGKVKAMCTAMIEALRNKGAAAYTLTILTALVHYKPPQLEEALTLVQGLRGKEREEALEYLAFLVPVDHLYDTALGLYDFDLVLLVAKKSQKDPREYFPFLARLQALPAALQKAEIDEHLHRYALAVTHLSQAGDEHFEHALALVRQHGLYTHARKLWTSGERRNRVLEAQAEALAKQKHMVEAALVWAQCGQTDKAIDAYRRCGHWRRALSLVHATASERVGAVAKEIADDLALNYRYRDAAFVHAHYCKDAREAVRALLQVGDWDEVMRLAHEHALNDMLTTELPEAVEEALQTMRDKVGHRERKIVKHYNRLVQVRWEMLHESEASGADEGMSDTSSMYSMQSASSARSNTTYTTIASARNASMRDEKNLRRRERKAKKKKLSGRKGNPREQEYLHTELTQALPSEHMQDEVKQLLRVLLELGKWNEAQQLQDTFAKLCRVAKVAAELINSAPVPTAAELEAQRRAEDELRKAAQKHGDETNIRALLMRESGHRPVAFVETDWRMNVFD